MPFSQTQQQIFLLALGAFQGAMLVVLLLRRRGPQPASLFLLLYLLVLLLQILMKVADKAWLFQHLRTLYLVAYDLPFLYGPLCWLFVAKTVDPHRRFRPVDWLHFLPFIYLMAATLIILLTDTHVLPAFSSAGTFGFRLTSLTVYHLLCFDLLKTSGLLPEQRRWMRQFTAVSFVLGGLLTTALFVMYRFHPRYSEVRYLFAAATLFIYWVSYQCMRHPARFALIPLNGTALPRKKYSHSTLKDGESAALLALLETLMETRRPYLDPALSIDALAAMAGTNRHHLSRVLNEGLQKNFYDYLNGYRVRTAQTLLADPKNEYLKIAALAYEAGFNSLSTFNDVFKKTTGQTPSEFRNSAQISLPNGSVR